MTTATESSLFNRTATAKRRRALGGGASRLALHSGLGAGVLLSGVLLATPAYADCGAGPDFVCDGGTGGITVGTLVGDSVTLTNGETMDAGQTAGLVVNPATGDINFAIDASSSITATTDDAVQLISMLGSIGTTTPTGSGINGDLSSATGIGLEAWANAAGSDIVLTQGASSTISGFTHGVYVNAVGGTGALAHLTLSGDINAQTGHGIGVHSDDLLNLTTSGKVSGVDWGIVATSGGNAIVSIAGGEVSAARGIHVASDNSINFSIAASAKVTGTAGLGVNLDAGRSIDFVNNGTLFGDLGALKAVIGASASSASSFSGAGTYESNHGSVIDITNNSTQDLNITIGAGGGVTAHAGDGIFVSGGDGNTTINVDGTIYASQYGITGGSGAGDITINVGSKGWIDPLVGISLVTVSGALTVNNAGLIEGQDEGVSLLSTGAGAVGDLTVAQSGSGVIRAYGPNGTAAVDLSATGDASIVVTGNKGLTLIDGANAQHGIVARTLGLGSISISDNTIIGTGFGIRAEQLGAATTGISVLGTGEIQATGNSGIAVFMEINNANNTGSIDYNRIGNLSGESGIAAYITNGKGSISINSVGDINAKESAISVGIRDTNANNANVNVTTSGGTINVSAGTGISVDHRGDGSGTTLITNHSAINVLDGNGISLNRQNGDGDSAIISDAAIQQGTGAPGQILRYGITANIGPGADGNLSIVQSTGDIGALSKRADYGGIFARSQGAATKGSISVSLVNASIYSVGDGIEIQKEGVGNTLITGTGVTKIIDSSAGYGINVLNKTAGNAGNLTINVGQSINGALGGIKAVSANTGFVAIQTGNSVFSSGGTGIYAENSNAGTTGNVDVVSLGTVIGKQGIIAINAGTGNVTVGVDANVTGTSGIGIEAKLTSATDKANSIGVQVSTGTTVASSSAAGVRTDLGVSSGAATVFLDGKATGAEAISQFSVGGMNAALLGTKSSAIGSAVGISQGSKSSINQVIVSAGGTVSGNTSFGINQANGTGINTVENNGSISGAVSGVRQTASGNAINSLKNTGTIVATGNSTAVQQDNVAGISQVTNSGTVQAIGGASANGIRQTGAGALSSIANKAGGLINATNIAVVQNDSAGGSAMLDNQGTITGGAGAVTGSRNGGFYVLVNSGTMNGRVAITGSSVGASSFLNLGTWNTSGVSTFSGGWTNSGTASFAAGATAAFSDNAFNTATGVINFAGSGGITAPTFTNTGRIEARNGTAGQLISLTGNYVGGGTLGLDVAIGSNLADRLAISGTASGTTNVPFVILNQGILPTGFLAMVTVGSGTPAANAFVSTTPLPTTGLLLETFGQNPANAQQFGIIQTVNPTAGQVAQLSTLADVGSMMLDDPVGALVADRSDREVQIGFWGRGSAGNFTQDLATVFVAGPGGNPSITDRPDTSYHVLETGMDVGLLNLGGVNLHLGVRGGHYGVSARVPGALTTISTDFVGGYVQLNTHGFELDANLRKEWREFRMVNPSLLAGGQATTDGTSWAGSVGLSYKANIGGLFVKPAFAYHWGSAKTDAFMIDAVSSAVPLDDKTGLLRFGGTVGWDGKVSSNLVLTPYIGAFGLHANSNTASTALTFNGSGFTAVTTSFSDALQLVGGLDLHNDANSMGLFLRGNAYTSHGVKGGSMSVGVRVNF